MGATIDGLVWLLRGNTLLTSTDRGSTWKSHDFPEPWASGIAFVDRNNGWRVSGGDLYGTSDGGETWALVGQLPETAKVAPAGGSIEFADVERGWFFGPYAIWRTDDGGVNWRPAGKPCQPNLRVIAYYTRDDAYAICPSGPSGGGWTPKALYRSNDGGLTWTLLHNETIPATPVPTGYHLPAWGGPKDLTALNEEDLWFVMSRQTALTVTHDGFHSLEQVRVPGQVAESIFAVALESPQVAYVASPFFALRTADGGADWCVIAGKLEDAPTCLP